MCRRPAPPLHPHERRTVAAPPRRVSQRAIELVGLALGIGFIAAVALRTRAVQRRVLVSWPRGSGCWRHHAIMGLDPFSYTESHRRWVTDEWGSELDAGRAVPGLR